MLPVPVAVPFAAVGIVKVVGLVTVTTPFTTFTAVITVNPVMVTIFPFTSPCAWDDVYVVTVPFPTAALNISVRAAVTVCVETAETVAGEVVEDVIEGVVTNAA
jgi:hypothetical protein